MFCLFWLSSPLAPAAPDWQVSTVAGSLWAMFPGQGGRQLAGAWSLMGIPNSVLQCHSQATLSQIPMQAQQTSYLILFRDSFMEEARSLPG